MIGAVIGDLAAWTWEQDRDCFNRKLVSDGALVAAATAEGVIWWGDVLVRLSEAPVASVKW